MTEGVQVDITREISAPASGVAGYVSDFRNAGEWMVGIDSIEQTGEMAYRLTLDSPVGKLRPEANVVEHRPEHIRWVYTSTVEGDGQVDVMEDETGCLVRYRGNFQLRSRILGRAAKAVGMEAFARRQGERSLERLKHLMEARRY